MRTIHQEDLLSRSIERAEREYHEKFKRETLPLDLKRPAVQERIRKMQAEKDAEKSTEPAILTGSGETK
jgi:hypothetical protein